MPHYLLRNSPLLCLETLQLFLITVAHLSRTQCFLMIGIELTSSQYKFLLLNDGQKYEAVLASTRYAIPFLILCLYVECFKSFILGLILLPFKTASLPAGTELVADFCQLFHDFEGGVLVIRTKLIRRHIKHGGDF